MDTQIVLGFEGRAYHARDFYASQVLSMILGGGMSSRLFQEVREKRGLCYSVYAFHWGFFGHRRVRHPCGDGQGGHPRSRARAAEGTGAGRRGDYPGRSSSGRGRSIAPPSSCRRKARPAVPRRLPGSCCSMAGRSRLEELMDRLSGLTVERLTDLSARMFSSTPHGHGRGADRQSGDL